MELSIRKADLTEMGGKNEQSYDNLKNMLYTDSAVAGETARYRMGLIMLATVDGRCADEVLAYARETRHEYCCGRTRGPDGSPWRSLGQSLIDVDEHNMKIGLQSRAGSRNIKPIVSRVFLCQFWY
ncbi:hypothetical protein DFH11DRAFT_1632892 [Phellopilus nigrolimitatus]|nr:hypothetical protein DFH11DRAFT_1632892 [Phellopilus nigrolimitatus]